MNTEEKNFGVELNAGDDRNIRITEVFPAAAANTANLPDKKITDISALPVENQLGLGTCVGQAEGKGEEHRDLVETGKFTRVSKRFIYDQSKERDGNPGIQGTWPAVAAGVLKDLGAPREELVPDKNDLSHEEYLKVEITDEIKTDASARRVKGFAYCLTLDDIRIAINEKGTINATLSVGDWSKMPVKPGSSSNLHRVLIYGYEKIGDDWKIYFRNSWGMQWGESVDGNGFFMWSEYEAHVWDVMAYVDMTNEIINYAKAQKYRFTRVLHIGMSGTDVMELQKRLNKETAFDGSPCYGYAVNGKIFFSTYFGPHTEEAVRRYQKTHGLVSSGDYKTTGYGQLGPRTMAALNADNVVPPKPASKLSAWADAIQIHEGWFPGSRSYRNNNPGNLRYVGQKRAIGKDSGNFCIFKTYADGRLTLEEMLTNAATGKSSVYNPEMTLLDFFSKYAPSADNNNPAAYAADVAKRIGVPVETQIKNLV